MVLIVYTSFRLQRQHNSTPREVSLFSVRSCDPREVPSSSLRAGSRSA
jgi:hypothetical protein